MAEKYGTIPKRFTSEWWSYFWEYYKWHTIAAATAIILIAVTAVQCATKEKYDMTVVYGGTQNFDETATETMEQLFEKYSEDSDGNGEVNIFFMPCTITNQENYDEYTYAMQTKLDLSMQDEGTFLYLFGKDELDIMLKRGESGESFLSVDEYLSNPDEENIVTSENAQCAYNLKDSSILKQSGIDCSDLYIAVRKNYKDNPDTAAAFENAKKLASELAK